MSNTPTRLFHGTDEDFTKPKAGGYDNIFWTADASTVAQTYIPEAGSTVYTRRVDKFQMEDSVRPIKNDPFYEIAQQMGFEFKNVEWDYRGWSNSWGAGEKGFVKYAQVIDHIEKNMGYESIDEGGGKRYAIKCDGMRPDATHNYVPSDYKLPGFLLIVTGHEDLKIYDMSKGEGDLTDVQYNKLGFFKKLQEQGYDGVKIDDFCQTKTWGNVGHESYGFFERALDRLQIERIPAKHFEWAEDARDFKNIKTPEFNSWETAKQAMEFIQKNDQAKSPALRA